MHSVSAIYLGITVKMMLITEKKALQEHGSVVERRHVLQGVVPRSASQYLVVRSTYYLHG